jgi:glucuronate isomerase
MSPSPLIHADFMLGGRTARRLFHDVAAALPIIDYHCHLDAAALASDRRFNDLTELWIATDPYKHRAMRILGIRESLITGAASAREKYDAWTAAVPRLVGNPLYHWTALELKRYFGIDEPLCPESADRIWEHAGERLRSAEFSARSLLARMNVACVCTSDTIADDLSPHAQLAGWGVKVVPSLRIDGLAPAKLDASRLDLFHRAGCRLADHALDVVDYDPASDDAGRFRELARFYTQRGWVLQLHLGAQRRTSSRLRGLVGPAGGYATIGSACNIPALCALLDDLEQVAALPRTILYPLNPSDYPALATLTGSFAQDGVAGKIQLGPAWWYNDHDLGIRAHLDALSRYGVLSTFIGFTTDSRSLLSMVRHEYFRRVLCDWIGAQVDAGLLPDDATLLDGLVRGICHDNAAHMLSLNKDSHS